MIHYFYHLTYSSCAQQYHLRILWHYLCNSYYLIKKKIACRINVSSLFPCKCSMAPFSHTFTSKEELKSVPVCVEVGVFSFFKLGVLSHRKEMSLFLCSITLKSQRFTLSPLASLCDVFSLPIKILKLENRKKLGSCRRHLEIPYNLKYKTV